MGKEGERQKMGWKMGMLLFSLASKLGKAKRKMIRKRIRCWRRRRRIFSSGKVPLFPICTISIFRMDHPSFSFPPSTAAPPSILPFFSTLRFRLARAGRRQANRKKRGMKKIEKGRLISSVLLLLPFLPRRHLI